MELVLEERKRFRRTIFEAPLRERKGQSLQKNISVDEGITDKWKLERKTN